MADQAPVIIIRRKKKGGHAGHHGGAWKVAYADFVTAMMAFFLLLWLLNVTTDVERKGIADYFAPASISKSESGAGGMFGGQTITAPGAEISFAAPPTTQDVTVPTVGKGEEGDEETIGANEGSKDNVTIENELGNVQSKDATGSAVALSKEEQGMVATMRKEEEGFGKAEDLLKQALIANPELAQFAQNIMIDRTPEGLRIQIIDRDKFSMFPSGAAIPYEKGRDLLMLVGKVIAKLPNQISVTGHTDSKPFIAGAGRDNWTLSTERANNSRAYLVKGGVPEERVARVSGLAGRDPLYPADPNDPRNRRISIVLLRQGIAPAPVKNDATVSPPPLPAAAPIEATPAPAPTEMPPAAPSVTVPVEPAPTVPPPQ